MDNPRLNRTMEDHTGLYGTIWSQTRKKIIFVREPEFGFGNVRTIHLDKFAK